MPIDSKECFAALTEDGQLWEIYQAAQTGGGGGGITSINGDTTAAQLISGTAPITASTAAGTTTISTSISTNRIVGRSTAGTGVMEELTPVGITVSGGNITGIGGTVGTVDNAVPRADGTGGFTVQGSDIVIDDAVPFLSGVTGLDSTDYITVVGNTFVANQQIFFGSLTGGSALTVNTPYFVRDVGGAGANTFRISTTSGGGVQTLGSNITAGTVGAGQTNVAIVNNHVGQTNSALVLTPKGTGAFILGPKPDGTATGGNARGTNAVDLQTNRTGASQVASGADSIVAGGARNTASGSNSIAIGGRGGVASLSYATVLGGLDNVALGDSSIVCGAGGSSATASYGSAFGSHRALADRRSMQAHASGQFSAQGDAQRARFVLRNSTANNTPTALFLDGSSTRLTIPVNKAMGFTIQVIGSIQGMAENAYFVRKGAIVNDNSTTTLIGSIETIGTDQKSAGATTTDVSITADDTNEALIITVTGIAAQNWRWVASVDAVEVQYL